MGGSSMMSGITNLAPAIRSSLRAKLERLLSRPLIAALPVPTPREDAEAGRGGTDPFRSLQSAAWDSQPSAGRSGQAAAWFENPDDGTCLVRVEIDYLDLWRGCEKEVLQIVKNSVDSPVTFLTEDQKILLERSPREFLALSPRPESAELVTYRAEPIGGSDRVVELTVATLPASQAHLRYVAIVPNLVQIQRQLEAIDILERASDSGSLAPLRALIGLCAPSVLDSAEVAARAGETGEPSSDERLDEFQTECITKAMSTPHFSVIQGPPGSGKTTVITSIIRRTVGQGGRVLVVSPTHAAVDNVVEKLVPRSDGLSNDYLAPHTLPVRYSARRNKLSARATEYWVGSTRQLRGATISQRLRHRMSAHLPTAKALYDREGVNAQGSAGLSASIAAVERVICGTPIGVLSYEAVKSAAPAAFDVLIVDEVSKMTLSEFLAIAVKAKRWILVGDPQQLPPYNGSEENGPTLDDVFEPERELVCSVGAFLERIKPYVRREASLIVVASDPARVVVAIRAHIHAVRLENSPRIGTLADAPTTGILVCEADSLDAASVALSPMRGRDRTLNPDERGSLPILVERGIRVARPRYASGTRLVESRYRCQPLIFENAFNVYHAQPWSERSGQKLPIVRFRNGLEKYLPSDAAVELLSPEAGEATADDAQRSIRTEIAARYAINTVSVYDWLTGLPADYFDVSPLVELRDMSNSEVCRAVQPYVGVLKKQYRMHPSLSRIPRELFYFDEALFDGKASESADCRVMLVQVAGTEGAGSETNKAECDRICGMLTDLNGRTSEKGKKPGIMVITPYREQRDLLMREIDHLRDRGRIAGLDVEVNTLDSCQGREAEYVLISLVRSKATQFFDMPKRWNVALTRAMQGLFIVGDIDSYLREAASARRDQRSQPREQGGQPRLSMSLLARILEAYDSQIAEHRRSRP